LPDDRGTMGNVVELTPLYAGQVADVRRAVKLHPDRTMSIEDEWTAAERAVTASWQWLTKAKVTRTPTGLLLEEAGRTLTLKVELPAETDAKIKVEDVSVPRAPQDSANANLSRIVDHGANSREGFCEAPCANHPGNRASTLKPATQFPLL